MRNLSFLAALLFSFAAAQAAPAAPSAGVQETPAQHPLVGSWGWKLPGKACTETYEYRANGSRAGSSGEEEIQGGYEVTRLPSLLGFYRLVETVTSANAKRDCSGDLHEVPDAPVTRFIQFNPKHDQFIACKTESLQACFGPLKKIPD